MCFAFLQLVMIDVNGIEGLCIGFIGYVYFFTRTYTLYR